MEPRLNRPKFYNPFWQAVRPTPYAPWLKGFFRAMPMHRWKLEHGEQILEFVARRPSIAGLPHLPTCIVNTAHLLPSARSRQNGVWVFGPERGCKSVVIPRSANGEEFDAVDVRLVEALFRWNPGLECVYLSRSCQAAAAQFVPHLAKLKSLNRLVLEGWDDAVAIHRVLMACKNVETLDLYTFDQPAPAWETEVAVQALNTAIEIHPKIRSVEGSRNALEQWYVATKHNRCKHNVALVPSTCGYATGFGAMSVAFMGVAAVAVYKILMAVMERYAWWHVSLSKIAAFFSAVAVFAFLVANDFVNRHARGRAWMSLLKYPVLLRRRCLWLDQGCAMNSASSSAART